MKLLSLLGALSLTQTPHRPSTPRLTSRRPPAQRPPQIPLELFRRVKRLRVNRRWHGTRDQDGNWTLLRA